jgi:two-component system, NarL family, sensor histidine kinase DesK
MQDIKTPSGPFISPEIPGDKGWGRWVYLAYLALYPSPWVFNRPSTTDVVVSLFGIGLFLLLYARHWDTSVPRLIAIVAATVLLSFALQPFGGVWGVLTIYSAAMIANLRPPKYAVMGMLAIVAAVLLFVAILQLHWSEWAFTFLFGAMVGASSILFATLQESNQRLAESRESARQMAIVAERERIARDLHDLLGHTLTVVAVKADLAAKLVHRDTTKAAAEIEDIRTTARSALADIRAAVTGMRSTTLAAELVQARQALAAAGVTLQYDGVHAPMPDTIEATLAFLIREGVTNVVRHAEATRCDIRISQGEGAVVLELEDDGKGARAVEGNGLRGMRARVEELAGGFSLKSDRGTKIRVQLPLAGAALSAAT